jgi:hypothetical protein
MPPRQRLDLRRRLGLRLDCQGLPFPMFGYKKAPPDVSARPPVRSASTALTHHGNSCDRFLKVGQDIRCKPSQKFARHFRIKTS